NRRRRRRSSDGIPQRRHAGGSNSGIGNSLPSKYSRGIKRIFDPGDEMAEMNDQERQLVEWLSDMNEDDAFALAKKMLLEEGANPIRVLELCRNAMDIVGKRFEKGEYFLPELVLAGEMLENIGAIAKPLIKQAPGEEPKKLAKVLIGTVHGDLHDIGKNIDVHARHQRIRGQGHRHRCAGQD